MQGFGSMLRDYLEFYKISQTDFAERLGISTKHMNEILNGKTNISEELMLGISLITDIDVNLIFYVESKKRIYDYLNSNFDNEKEINKYLNTFCINEMAKKKWITLKNSSSYTQNAMDLLDYLGIASFDNVSNYLNHKILYKKKEDADINKIYLANKELSVEVLGRGYSWLDTGTFDSLNEASDFVRSVQKNGQMIACLEEIAYLNGWVDAETIRKIGEGMSKNSYGKYLIELSKTDLNKDPVRVLSRRSN